MVDIDFSVLFEYSQYDEDTGERIFDEIRLENEAPADVKKIYAKYRELKNEEIKTGLTIF